MFDPEHLDFLKLLNQYQVEYMVIGGHAVNFYGYNRSTGDLDVWINKGKGNKESLIKAILDFGYNTDQLEDFPANELMMFSLGSKSTFGHIEITNQIAGLRFTDAFLNKKNEVFEEIPINLIDYQDLLKTKKAAGRFKDLDDIENLTKLNRDRK